MIRFLLYPLLILVQTNECIPASNDMLQHPDLHKGIAREVVQTNHYTYIRITNLKDSQWLAVPKTEVVVGKTYYYGKGILMPDFFSKELNRTFPSVLLLERVFPEPGAVLSSAADQSYTAAVKNEKIDVSIEAEEGMVTISGIWENKDRYSGKVIVIKGQVTKYNARIMGKNWIHIQDGTAYKEHYDLTVTCDCTVKVGDIITLQGTIVADKDFGYGYKYEILMENAVPVK
ncbi:MAG: hypothetical protein GXO83_07750 [Chlorobi bacterium]|nr:hypothetical protein [Chlorobiota bacterium]